MKYNKDYKLAVYIALLSTSISSVFSLLSLLVYYKRLGLKKQKGIIIKELLITSIPFLILGISLNLYQLIDSMFYVRSLLKIGITNAKYYYGIYSFEISKLIMIPVSLSIGYATSLLPNLATRKKDTISKALYQIFIIIFPVFLFTFVKGESVYKIFFKTDDGGNMLKIYSVMIVLLSFNQITSSVMQGINKGKSLIKGIFISIILKLILTYPFMIIFNIYGSLVSSIISLSFIIIYNLIYLKKELDIKYVNEILVSIVFSFVSLIGLRFSFNNYFIDVLISSALYFMIYFILHIIHYFLSKNKNIYI